MDSFRLDWNSTGMLAAACLSVSSMNVVFLRSAGCVGSQDDGKVHGCDAIFALHARFLSIVLARIRVFFITSCCPDLDDPYEEQDGQNHRDGVLVDERLQGIDGGGHEEAGTGSERERSGHVVQG